MDGRKITRPRCETRRLPLLSIHAGETSTTTAATTDTGLADKCDDGVAWVRHIGDSEAGCGCRTEGREPGEGAAFTSLVALAGWLLRRRRA